MSEVGEIESGIPMPRVRGRKKGPVALKVEALKVGDSFPITTPGHAWSAYWTARRLGIVITVGHDETTGTRRVWRKA